MRPDIIGKGFETEFAQSIIDCGKQKSNYDHINLIVAKFNKRAIKVYEKLGVKVIEEYISPSKVVKKAMKEII